ncbi:MAG: TRAP transporter large permease subunit [Sandaracinaceae bacterium]|nr:TRAP transporter large permease subunit [Sandaracinaceae bacterium]
MNEPSGAAPKSVLSRIDDGIFAIEQSIVAVFLTLITLGSFADVVERRLVAPDSKVGQLLARIAGIEDAATRASIDHTIAPIVSVAIGGAILWFAWSSAERGRGKPFLAIPGSAIVLTLGTGAVLALGGWLMVTVSSSLFTLVVGSIVALGYAAYTWRDKTAGWQGRLASIALGAPVFVWFCLAHIPEGYGWGKEISMLFTLWVGFFGASICVHEGKHIRLEALEKIHPEAHKHLVSAVGHAVAALFALFLGYLGILYLGDQIATGGELSQTELPQWVQTVVVPIAFGLTAIRSIAAAVSALRGGSYGMPAKAEGMEDAEKLAAAADDTPSAPADKGSEPDDKASQDPAKRSEGDDKPSKDPAKRPEAAAEPKRPIAFLVVLALIVVLFAIGGNAGRLLAVILSGALLALPLYAVLGMVTVACFVLWLPAQSDSVEEFKPMVEQIVSLADNEALLAIPLFILSGAIMAKGEISKRLVGFARALVGWMPGGLAISAVLACMIFAAISGSSPATVVAIGGVMAPAMIAAGYQPSFTHGLVTSSGSLGILIPPSIPMIVYAIVNTTTQIRVEDLFASGYGPGLVIGGILMGYSVFRGVVDKTPRDTFDTQVLMTATRDGFWSLLFPFFIFFGTNFGIFTAVEAAAASVVYAAIVELFLHRAIKPADLFGVFQEVGVMLGSFLVILVVARSFGEFLVQADVPTALTEWFLSMNLDRTGFLLMINVLLLIVGCLMDIMSAIFIFVPLIAPIAQTLGIDPLHLGIIFIVNLEIGYLTPPVGLNLFVASTLFNKPLGYVIRSVLPFIGLMSIGLLVITYYPPISGDFGRWITGSPAFVPPDQRGVVGGGELEDEGETSEGTETGSGGTPTPACANGIEGDYDCDGTVTMEEMMRLADEGSGGDVEGPAHPACANGIEGDYDCDGNVSMEEMMRLADEQAAAEDAGTEAP